MISLRTLLLCYRRHLRVQPLRELMAVAGVAAGVALLFTVQIANHSVTGSFEEIEKGVAGRATLEVAARSPEGMQELIAEEVAHTAGVRAAAPILQQQIVAVGAKGSRALTLVGADERLFALGGDLASHFKRYLETSPRGLLVLTESTAKAIGARSGQTITVKIGANTERLSVAGIVAGRQTGILAESPVAAASLPVVQVLAGLPGHITRILIEPAPERYTQVLKSLTRRLGSALSIRPISSEGRLLAQAARPESQLTMLFSAISLVVGIILAYNALLLASGERRRFILYLVDLGSEPSTIVATLAFDALVLGVAGCALGLLLGDLISLYAYRAVPGYLSAAFAIGPQRVIGLQTILIALAAGMIAAFAAAALPAIGLLRSSTAQMTDDSRWLSLIAKPRIRDSIVFAIGALFATGAILAALLEPLLSVAALIALVGGLVLCTPMIVRYTLKLARAASRHSNDPATRLSSAELQISPTRSVALVVTGTIAVFLMVTIGGAVADVKLAVRMGAADTLASADLWVTDGGRENIYDTEPFAYQETQHRLEHLETVSSIVTYRQSFLDLPDRRVLVIGIPPQARVPIAASQLINGNLKADIRRLREGGWALISQIIASQYKLRLGERFSLPTPSGTTSFRLAGTISNYGWLPGAILMNGDQYSRLWHTTRASQLAVTLKPGTPIDKAKQEVEQTLSPSSALTVQTDNERQAQASTVLDSTLSRLAQTSTVALITAIATVVAMMIAAVWQRRGRLDALMAMGMSPTQLSRLIIYETGTVLILGCLIGLVSGLMGQYLVDAWLHQSTGSPVHFVAAWQLGLRTLLIASAISIATALIAVLRTTARPKAAFSTE
ncbi:MAG TPA: ABC transporter permease [Solirubrobacteraceae bacterium]|jgi:putative ABC transport system permease protein|nr:ABC transporter permease [Solirubrobacteraceae bacterium]